MIDKKFSMKNILLFFKWIFIIVSVVFFLQSQRYDSYAHFDNNGGWVATVHDKYSNKWFVIFHEDMDQIPK